MARQTERYDPLPDSFLELPDTPSSYEGQSGKAVVVKPAEDGVEFQAVGGGGTLEVKSGITPPIEEGTIHKITFATPFSSTPHAVVSFHDTEGPETSRAYPVVLDATKLWIQVIKIGFGPNVFRIVSWIATTAGDS